MEVRILALLPPLLAGLPVAAQLRPPEVAAREEGVQRTRFVDEACTLYNFRWTLTRREDEGQVLLRFLGHGDNDRRGVERVEWTERALAVLGARGVVPVYWRKDSRGAEQESWHLQYDWSERRARYRYRDHRGGDREQKTIPLAAGTLPSDWMTVMLRGFPFERGAGYELQGAFVLTDGSVLEGAVVHRGEETLHTAFGPLPAYKLEMKPSGLVGVFAPSLFLWYSQAPPHLFLRFDGKDAGYFEDRTTNELVRFEPAALLRGDGRGGAPGESGAR